jgi:hypothetical protein
MKKSSKKKVSKQKRSTSPDLVASLNIPSSTDSDAELSCQIVRDVVDTPSVRRNAEVKADTSIQEFGERLNPNWIGVAVMKMFLIVILGLGTQRFAVWITLSAFLLFFLDYVGKQFSRFFNKHSSDLKKIGKIGLEKKSVISVSPLLIENSELSLSTADILQQPESNLSPTIESSRSVIDSEDNFCETSEISEPFDAKLRNRRKSKMAKVGSKMKKLVPKNLRKSKKKHPESESLTHNSIEVDQCENQTQEQEQHQELGQCEVESEEVAVISDVFSGDSKATKVAEQESETKRVGNLRYWFICLIVLTGLVGGKILALGLTLIWCLILKSGGISRKLIRVPLSRTSLKFST